VKPRGPDIIPLLPIGERGRCAPGSRSRATSPPSTDSPRPIHHHRGLTRLGHP
jgi:hypothetical protein